MNTFAETEALLKSAIILSQSTVKEIAGASGIKPNTLYKWKTTDVHLSPAKADALLLYFMENEAMILIKALLVNTITDILQDYSTSLSEQEVLQEE